MKKPKQFKPRGVPNANKFVKKVPEEKKTATKGYDGNWNRYRFRFLHHNPNCYACGINGGRKLHVDHIITHRGEKELFWKVDNFIPLCASCHSTVTALFEKGDVSNIQGKLKWLSDKRVECNTKVRVKIVPFKGENV